MTAPDAQQQQERAGREPGRALDIEVQRVVFGTKRMYCRNGDPWCEHCAKCPTDRAFFIPSDKPWRTHHIDALPVPQYSTDISSAWLIVERLKEIGLGFVLAIEGDAWEVEISTTEALSSKGYRGNYTEGCSAPEVICRAALRAIAALGTREEVGGDA